MLVMLIGAIATLVVVVRAMIEDTDNGQDTLDAILGATSDKDKAKELQQLLDSDAATPLSNKNSYKFLQAYVIELAMAWFLWFFLFEGIFFSGILSCGGCCLPSPKGDQTYFRGWKDLLRQHMHLMIAFLSCTTRQKV